MITEGLLFATEADKEFAELEEKILLHCSDFGALPEEKRKFVVWYLVEFPRKGMRAVADRAGISKTTAYELSRDPQIMTILMQAAQVISTLGDLRCSVALDMLADDMCKRIARGELRAESVTPTMLRVLEAGKTRLGLNPSALTALKLKLTGKDGSSSELTFAEINAAEDTISRLVRDRTRTQEPVSIEDNAESVRSFSSDVIG